SALRMNRTSPAPTPTSLEPVARCRRGGCTPRSRAMRDACPRTACRCAVSFAISVRSSAEAVDANIAPEMRSFQWLPGASSASSRLALGRGREQLQAAVDPQRGELLLHAVLRQALGEGAE